MEITNYKKRIIDSTLEKYLKIFGAILIEGPKWCGKTWTSRYHCNSQFLVGNLNNKKLALLDPNIALEGSYPHLVDEWQEVPSIWDAVRYKIDEDNLKGRFILTGSTIVHKDSYIHSGTGRISRLKMRPMSLYESGASNGKISLKDLCINKEIENIFTGDISLTTIIDLILKGGWPASLEVSTAESLIIAKEYIKSIIQEDIYKIDFVNRDANKIELLLKSLARNESTTASNNTLKRDIIEIDLDDINSETISKYLNIFNSLYISENIPPFSPKIRSSLRVKQSYKRHFVDPSLPSAILNLTKEKLLNDLELLGFLFESLVIRDILTYAESFNAKVFHYQDYKGNEIDLILELEDSSFVAIEIKLGAHQIDDAANNLIKINNTIKKEGGKEASLLLVISGLSNAAYKRNDGVFVIPITSLKN